MMRRALSVVALAVGAAGCSGGVASEVLDKMEAAEFHTAEDVRPWTGGSAPSLYNMALARGASLQQREDACPSKAVNGNTTTWTGDCTDAEGLRWEGSLTDVRDAPGSISGTTTYEGFGSKAYENFGSQAPSGECEGAVRRPTVLTGKVAVTGSTTDIQFDLDLKIEGTSLTAECVVENRVIGIDYQGTVKGAVPTPDNSGMGRSTWNGKGRFGESSEGVVSVETVDEVIDRGQCLTEALSGSTTITAGHHVAVVTYDGATDCAEDSTSTWTLDGEAKGELQGVGCSAAGGLSAWALLALGGLGLRRRRLH